jgi:hypothetical protein
LAKKPPPPPPPPTAPADDYRFTQVGPSLSPFDTFCPQVNNGGELALSNRDGIFFGTPGDLRLVVSTQEHGLAPIAGTLLVNDAGDIAFSAFRNNTTEIAVFHDGQVQTVATTGDPDLEVTATSLNNRGQIAYLENLNDSYDQGLFLWENGESVPVLLPGSGPVAADGGAVLNNAGQLAFKGPGPDGRHHVFLYQDGVYTEVPVPAGVKVWEFGLVGLTDDGAVLLSGWRDGRNGLFALADGHLTTVVDSTGYDYLNRVATNDVGRVAVTATYNNWTASGTFDGPDVAKDKVVVNGDALFGSTVISVSVCGLNNAGQISLTGSLANGTGFRALASPVS